MKIKPEHVEHMRAAIAAAEANPYYAAQLPAFRAAVTPKRYRWDVARAAKLIPFFCDTLYAYANDDHIDTALRHIFGHKA